MPFDKRVVLEHTSGKLKGVHSICGLAKDAPQPLPEFNAEVEMQDHVGPVCLVAVKRSYVLYREIAPKQGQKEFDRRQV